MLEIIQEVKTATRNIKVSFYDEQGKHRRTKKEILDDREIFSGRMQHYSQRGSLGEPYFYKER